MLLCTRRPKTGEVVECCTTIAAGDESALSAACLTLELSCMATIAESKGQNFLTGGFLDGFVVLALFVARI